MKVIDSSVLVALFFSEDAFHEGAKKLMNQHALETVLLSDVITFETLTVLNYYMGIEKTQKAYEELLNNKYIVHTTFSEDEKREILAIFFSQIGKKLSVQDCSVAYLARKHHIGALSFDRGINAAIVR